MSTIIPLTDEKAISSAINWCDTTFPAESVWVIRAEFSINITYNFIFDNDLYATLFALRWVH